MNLFIIGNGFDVAHGLRTSYIDFRKFLDDTDWEYLVNLEKPYGFVPESNQEWVEKHLWREFESNLSAINEDEIVDGCMSIEMGLEGGDIGIEDTLNEYWEDQYGYISKLNDYIKTWVEQIEIEKIKKTSKIKRNSNDVFFSFNYTLLLEKLYKIDSSQIVHIHGSIDEENDISPVIGHGNTEIINTVKAKADEATENFWEKDTSIYNALANYYKRTLKDVNYYVNVHNHFFKQLKPVEQVFVIGHSFGDVDLPYFKKVLENVNENTIWNVYYYDVSDALVFKEKLLSIGIKTKNIVISSSSKFFDKK